MSLVFPSVSDPGFVVERGTPLPLGASERAGGLNFALFSRHATRATLVLYRSGVHEPLATVLLDPSLNRTGDIWHVFLRGADPSLRWGWRLDGPNDPARGHRFEPGLTLLDPYAKVITGGSRWGQADFRTRFLVDDDSEPPYLRRCALPPQVEFDWEGDVPLRTPMAETVIYELHVRGYTAHASAQVGHPGTFHGLQEKIPYLRGLGVTAVELMPVFEFNENEQERRHPDTGERLPNYWGYSPVSFFAPKASFASDGKHGRQVIEFKEMVKAFHRAGIEVYLDVVFNHTAEGDERGPTLSWRGIDNRVYYLLDDQGGYLNFSGCGNTLNCNHPLIRDMILDSLRYWVAEMHVDGFRFDLASILGRGPSGEVLANPPLLERIALDPVLADTKIIAEAWDAAGLYQVGNFPSWGRWAEWNGYFRDDVRRFWQHGGGAVSGFASRLCGSDDLYARSGRAPYHSINFLTAHDGFTLADLVSYEHKHNEANGEENRDGENNNYSCNHGVEGPTQDPDVLAARRRHVRNLLACLFLSQGVPMLLAGDEFGRSQQGNNNAYCQDNELSWVDWSLAERNADLLRFVRGLIRMRRRHPSLRRQEFFGEGPAISWHGERAYQPNWAPEARSLAFLLHRDPTRPQSQDLFILMNASDGPRRFEVPDVGRVWRRVVDTSLPAPFDLVEDPAQAQVFGRRVEAYELPPHTVVVLLAD